MKRKSILLSITMIMILVVSAISFSQSTITQATMAKPITIIVDGKEVEVNCITENGQLFIAIDELAPNAGLKLDVTGNNPVLTSIPSTEKSITKVKFDFNATIISNDSVGNEWNYYIKLNNNTYYSNDLNKTVDLDGKNLEFQLVAYEHDDGKSDFGFASVVVPYADIVKGNALTFTKTITVTENAGRYSGNTATVQFNLTLSPL